MIGKFTDEQLLGLYNQNLSDKKIASILGVAENSIWKRRMKLHLVANYESWNHTKLTYKQTFDRRRKILEQAHKTVIKWRKIHRKKVKI